MKKLLPRCTKSTCSSSSYRRRPCPGRSRGPAPGGRLGPLAHRREAVGSYCKAAKPSLPQPWSPGTHHHRGAWVPPRLHPRSRRPSCTSGVRGKSAKTVGPRSMVNLEMSAFHRPAPVRIPPASPTETMTTCPWQAPWADDPACPLASGWCREWVVWGTPGSHPLLSKPLQGSSPRPPAALRRPRQVFAEWPGWCGLRQQREASGGLTASSHVVSPGLPLPWLQRMGPLPEVCSAQDLPFFLSASGPEPPSQESLPEQTRL